MRTGEGALHFFINGERHGLTASGVPQGVYAVVDIRGRCTQVSISSPGVPSTPPEITPPPIPSVSLVPSDHDEMRRYRKQRQWIQECRRVPFSSWLSKELSSASSDEEKREVFLFIKCFGHRLGQDTVTCDGCDNEASSILGGTPYRCMQCEDLDLCQTCFREERTPKDHELNHKVAEMRWRCNGNDCDGLITGTRFHCLVCDNFDLCYGCQATKNWPARHLTNHSMERSSTLRTSVYADVNIYGKSTQVSISSPGVPSTQAANLPPRISSDDGNHETGAETVERDDGNHEIGVETVERDRFEFIATVKVGNLNSEDYRSICSELNPENRGRDYKSLAGKMGYNRNKVKEFELSPTGNPTDALLSYWGTESSNTVKKLMEYLKEMGNDVAAELLERSLEKLWLERRHENDDNDVAVARKKRKLN